MLEFLTGAIFMFFVLPVGGLLLQIWIKIASGHRRTNLKAIFDVGFDLISNALVMLVALTFDHVHALTAAHRSLAAVLGRSQSNPAGRDLIAATDLVARARGLSDTIAKGGGIIFLIFMG